MSGNFSTGRTSEGSFGHGRTFWCIIDYFSEDVLVGECAIGGAFDLKHDIVYKLTKQRICSGKNVMKGYQFLSYLWRHSLRMSMKSFFTLSMSFPIDCVSFMNSLNIPCHFQLAQRFFLHFASYFYWRWSSSFLYFFAFSSVRRQVTSKLLILLFIWFNIRFNSYYLIIQFCSFSFRTFTSFARSYRFSFYTLLGCFIFFLEVIASECYSFTLKIYSFSASFSSLSRQISLQYLLRCSSIYFSTLLNFYSEILAISCASFTMSSYFLDPFRLSSADLDLDLPLSSFIILMTSSYSLIFSS